MTMINLTVTRTPLEIAALFDKLRAAPVGEVFAALGLPSVEVARTRTGLVAYVGDGPNSAEVTFARAPLTGIYDRTRTHVDIAAHDREGRALAVLLTAALEA
jgi:hypothetical protein